MAKGRSLKHAMQSKIYRSPWCDGAKFGSKQAREWARAARAAKKAKASS